MFLLVSIFMFHKLFPSAGPNLRGSYKRAASNAGHVDHGPSTPWSYRASLCSLAIFKTLILRSKMNVLAKFIKVYGKGAGHVKIAPRPGAFM